MEAVDNQTEVELRCEMLDYIRPDEDLQWYDPDRQPIVSGTNRRTIVYQDGTPDTAQIGGDFLTSSRVAVLTISDPQVSDSGTYFCVVEGTREGLGVDLIVAGMYVNVCIMHNIRLYNMHIESTISHTN